MNSKLRPHLYSELLGMFKTCIRAPALCNFALSSRDAYFTVARRLMTPYQKVVKNEYEYDDDESGYEFLGYEYRESIFHTTMNDLLFEFTEKCNISPLLRLSGKHIQYTPYPCPPKAPWNIPFYDGVSENECLKVLDPWAGRSFVEAYVLKRDTVDHVEIANSSVYIADLLENKTVRKLSVGPIDARDIEITRVLNVEILRLNDFHFVIEKQFAFHNKHIKYRANLETLKRVEFAMYTSSRTAILYLQKWRSIKELVFDEVSGCRCYRNLSSHKELVNHLDDNINRLWKAMLKFPGHVTVKYQPSLNSKFDARDVANFFHQKRGFKMSEDDEEIYLQMEMTAVGETTKRLEIKAHLSLI